ncbi:hypothetical protein FRACYDRAFT_247904 [Fragilariopsis cylindrus CCMP1102]|uniref:Uncharacterized protein n=1 Tax=Fragilariopsis cylindrus CCMP1102 TaxID=635003 RepID=A0A1E7EUE2_9STRA|nr:hypothetical protein FRACYDRAFT_247904 [Fragilariopsis cylindrus CCMP1102]|eukprot:OEU09650.1 hypothetical protein FRACYDRAFT_247904 [Fragilariopsis cylindrus CCMP1102]
MSTFNLNLDYRTPNTTTTATSTSTANKKTTMKTNRTKTTTTMKKKRSVRLNNTITISEIPHICTYTEYERLSSWYTADDYLLFKLDHEYRCLRYEKERRSTCIKAVQYLMLQAQYNERIYIINSDPRAKKFDLFTQWLSEFYIIHSKECIIAGQQRALENYRVIACVETTMKSPSSSPTTTLLSPTTSKVVSKNHHTSPLILSSSLFLLEPMISNNNTPDNNVNNNNNISNSRILQAAQSLMMVDGGIGGTGVDSNSNSNLNSNNHCKRLSAAIESCPSTVDENTIMPIKRNGRKKARRNSFVCIF